MNSTPEEHEFLASQREDGCQIYLAGADRPGLRQGNAGGVPAGPQQPQQANPDGHPSREAEAFVVSRARIQVIDFYKASA